MIVSSEENVKQKYRNTVGQQLYNAGLNIIPALGKKPKVKWSAYQGSRVPLDELIKWGQNPFGAEPLNWLIITGHTPWDPGHGIVVLDADDAEAEAVVAKYCPPTPIKQRTGKGGTHYIYRRPPLADCPYIPIRAKTSVDGQSYNLDVRADGGYIVAPGGKHQLTGKYYSVIGPEWTAESLATIPVYSPFWIPHTTTNRPKDEGINNESSTTAPLPELDDSDLGEARRQVRAWLASRPASEQGKAADNYCMALAMGVVWGFLLPEDDAVEELLIWGQRGIDNTGSPYRWTEKEIRHKVTDALGLCYDGEPGDLLDLSYKVDSIVATAMIDSARRDESRVRRTITTVNKKENRRKAYKLSELAAFKPAEFLIQNHFTLKSFVCLVGPSGCGKTFIALDYALSVVSSLDYLGTYKVKQGPVAYVAAEGAAGIVKRADAWLKHHNQAAYPDDFCILPDRYNLLKDDEASLVVAAATDALGCHPSIVIVDTLARTFGPGCENSPEDMNAFVAGCDHIRDICGATVIILHHTGKDPERKERGHSSLRAASDTLILCEPTDKGAGCLISCDKQKDYEEFESYILKKKTIHLGVDELGQERTSLVLVGQDQWRTRFQLLPPGDKAFLYATWDNHATNVFSFTTGLKSSTLAKTAYSGHLKKLTDDGFLDRVNKDYKLSSEAVSFLLTRP